jgi:hypothetical protein
MGNPYPLPKNFSAVLHESQELSWRQMGVQTPQTPPLASPLSKQDMIDSLFEWVDLFIEYKDYDIEDVVFKLLLIQIPTGAGGRRNAIVDANVAKQ